MPGAGPGQRAATGSRGLRGAGGEREAAGGKFGGGRLSPQLSFAEVGAMGPGSSATTAEEGGHRERPPPGSRSRGGPDTLRRSAGGCGCGVPGKRGRVALLRSGRFAGIRSVEVGREEFRGAGREEEGSTGEQRRVGSRTARPRAGSGAALRSECRGKKNYLRSLL